jgi:hypothetical protein
MKYQPIRILRRGSVSFDGETMRIEGWRFDLGGRPGAACNYGPEVAAAIGNYILDAARRHGADEDTPPPVDAGLAVLVDRQTMQVLERMRGGRGSVPTGRATRTRANWPLIAWGAAWCAATVWLLAKGLQ